MNKAELVAAIAKKIELERVAVAKILDAFEEIVIVTLKAGGGVTLTGFGTFSARRRAGRVGVNPRNPSEKIQVPAVTVPKFKAGKTLKDALKK